MKTRFPYNKFGIACDPRGAQVTLEYGGRMLLGDVTGVYYKPGPAGGTRLVVRHFNGEPWPIDPCAAAVQVFVREYESEE